MSLPSTAIFTNSHGKAIAYGFINCGWFSNPGSVLNSVPESYRWAKKNGQIKRGIIPESFKDCNPERLKDMILEIKRIEEKFEVEMFPENWENEWTIVEAYDYQILRNELIRLNKGEVSYDTVVENMEYRYKMKNHKQQKLESKKKKKT